MTTKRPFRRAPQRGAWSTWLAPALLIAATAIAVHWIGRDGDDPRPTPPVVRAAALPLEPAAAAGADATPARAPFSDAGSRRRAAERALWAKRLERAQQTLDTYRRTTRYPPTSQPLAEHGDQAHPDQPIAQSHPLGRGDGPEVDGLVLHTTQQRVFVQGDESVRFTVSLQDRDGRALPLRVVRAGAREIAAPNTASLANEAPLAFVDDGSGTDEAPGDRIHTAVLQPSTQGFARIAGQIRVEVLLDYRGQPGRALFDVFYTPEPPARWLPGVQEAVDDGSLVLTLKMNVRQAGRYLVGARVDDANGKPLALLAFNEELPLGDQPVRLAVFGKLLRDAKPAFPLTLRDVDAFLLHPDAFPDRSLMPRLAGAVHTTREYPLAAFSDAEWAGEPRRRYVDELGREVDEARAQLERLGGGR